MWIILALIAGFFLGKYGNSGTKEIRVKVWPKEEDGVLKATIVLDDD